MRQMLAAAVALLVAAPAFAQNSSSPLAVYLDTPSASQRVAPDVHFDGWAINCRTGRHTASIVLARNDASGAVVFVPATVHWGPRPDVQAAAAVWGCSMPELAVGFTVVPNAPQPVGLYRYELLITDMQRDPDSINWSASIRRTVTVQ